MLQRNNKRSNKRADIYPSSESDCSWSTEGSVSHCRVLIVQHKGKRTQRINKRGGKQTKPNHVIHPGNGIYSTYIEHLPTPPAPPSPGARMTPWISSDKRKRGIVLPFECLFGTGSCECFHGGKPKANYSNSTYLLTLFCCYCFVLFCFLLKLDWFEHVNWFMFLGHPRAHPHLGAPSISHGVKRTKGKAANGWEPERLGETVRPGGACHQVPLLNFWLLLQEQCTGFWGSWVFWCFFYLYITLRWSLIISFVSRCRGSFISFKYFTRDNTKSHQLARHSVFHVIFPSK